MVKINHKFIVNDDLGAFFKYIDGQKAVDEDHIHDFYEIFIVVQGVIKHVIFGNRQILNPGNAVFIRPLDMHCFETDEPGLMLNIVFKQETFDKIINLLDVSNVAQSIITNKFPKTVTLTPDILNKILSQLNVLMFSGSSNMQKGIQIRALLTTVVSYFLLSEIERPRMPDWLEKLCIEINKVDNFTCGIERFYELTDKSPEYVSREIKKFLNMTPTDYINSLKINYAKNLFLTTNKPIIDIIYQAGFNNINHFYYLFKKQFNTSPAKFKKENTKIL